MKQKIDLKMAQMDCTRFLKQIIVILTHLALSRISVSSQSLNLGSLSPIGVSSSSKMNKNNWWADPVNSKIFIENKGQFDELLPDHKKILFSTRLGNNTDVFFTSDGVTYCYTEFAGSKEDKFETEEVKEREVNSKPKKHWISSNWLGANPKVTIEPTNKRDDVYIYPFSVSSTIKADLFKKIIYRNLYKGIDVEYFFPEGKEGIKYNLIIHSGADISQIKIKYKGAKKIRKNNTGDIVISSGIGDFVEHAPKTYTKEGDVISSAFNLNDAVISFQLLDSEFLFPNSITQTIIIDPWITNLSWFYNWPGRGPWDLDCDDKGNVYCVADIGWVKIDNTGNVAWTIPRTDFPNYFSSDVTVDRATGNVYITLATGQLFEINTNGNLLAKYISTPDFFHEMWRIDWDPCRKQLAIGAGGTGTSNTQAAWTDANLSFMNYVNIEGANKNQHDIAGIAIDPSGSDCYMAASNGQYDTLLNRLIKVPMPTLSPTTWLTWNKYNLAETQSNYYAGSFPWYNGMNILDVSPNWVYMGSVPYCED